MRHRRPPLAAVAVAVTLAVALAAGCSTASGGGAAAPTSTNGSSSGPSTSAPAAATTPSAPPTTSSTPPSTAATVAWAPCGGGVECATLAVPLDPDQPDDGRTVDLALTRKRATGTRLGSLLVNPGGPGGSGNDFLRSFSLPGASERFDVVSWDPRGVGDSRPLGCDGAPTDRFRRVDSQPDDRAEQDDLDAAARAVAEACASAAAELLPHLRTADTVADLDRIREALGEDQISYLGFSYGTDLGQA